MPKFQDEIAWCREERRKALHVVETIERGWLRVFREANGGANEDWTIEYQQTQRELAEKMAQLGDSYKALDV